MKLVLTGENIEELLRSTEQQLSVERLCTIGESTWQFTTAAIDLAIDAIDDLSEFDDRVSIAIITGF